MKLYGEIAIEKKVYDILRCSLINEKNYCAGSQKYVAY